VRRILAVGVTLLVAVGSVAAVAVSGGGVDEMAAWGLLSLVPGAIVALGALPSGYSDAE
jgi:hypothetical protein